MDHKMHVCVRAVYFTVSPHVVFHLTVLCTLVFGLSRSSDVNVSFPNHRNVVFSTLNLRESV